MKTTKTALQQVMDSVPQLTDFGIALHWSYRKKSQAEREQAFRQQRQSLADREQDFAATCEWIAENLKPIASINRKFGSYGLKHIAEKEIGYISNGVLIAAMIHMGYKWIPNGPNALFNVSQKSIKQANKRVGKYIYL